LDWEKQEEAMNTNDMTRRNSFAAGGLAALAVAGVAPSARAADAGDTDAEKANIKLVTDFCQSWNTPDKAAAMLATDAAVRMYLDKPAIIGAAAVGAEMTKYMSTVKVKVDIRKNFAEGPVVVNVRTDTIVAPGKPDHVYQLVGVFLVKNGKIQEWVDYNAA
jgi:limonene-1,2-epoxide hydrolase